MNTDGVGSDILGKGYEYASGEGRSMVERGPFSLIGRAKTTLNGFEGQSLGMDDLDVGHESLSREEEAPPMTQLGYEDPVEAILLREKLAATRRKRSKLGQKQDDPPPVATRPKAGRKIRDDDFLAGTGWGAGRRTRHQQKSPPAQGITEF
jgi:hypothetical protein